jgi:hypothetical protein
LNPFVQLSTKSAGSYRTIRQLFLFQKTIFPDLALSNFARHRDAKGSGTDDSSPRPWRAANLSFPNSETCLTASLIEFARTINSAFLRKAIKTSLSMTDVNGGNPLAISPLNAIFGVENCAGATLIHIALNSTQIAGVFSGNSRRIPMISATDNQQEFHRHADSIHVWNPISVTSFH